MPQKQTHQIAFTALRSAAPVSGGFGPERVGRLPSLCHGLKFRQHFVDEGVNIGKRIPRARRGLCRTDGGSHGLPRCD
jgi:hypothetical protein